MADNTVWVPVLASMKGFISSVNKGAGQAAKSAGSTLEKGLGDAGRKGGESAAAQLAASVEKATTKVVAARHKEASAAGALGTAEQELANIRARGDASAAQIMAAEAKVSDARRTQETMAARLSAAEGDLDAVRAGEPARASSVVTAETRLEDARLKQAKAADTARAAAVALDEAKDRSKAASERLATAEAAAAAVRERGDATAREVKAAESEVSKARTAAEKASKASATAEGKLRTARSDSESAADQVRAADLRHKAALDDVAQSSRDAEGATDDLTGSMSELEGGMGSVRELATKGGGLLAGAGLALGASEVLGSVDAISQMNNQMGLTGGAAEAMGDQVSSVLRSGLASSTEEAAGAIGALNSQFGYLGTEGERTADDLAQNFLAFSRTFGTDINEAVMMAGNLVTNGLASDVTEAADLMTAAMQRVPAAMRDELPEIMGEYGTNFRALGFDGEEAFSLLVASADKGKWALDKTGDALKEFTIRGSDMSTASQDAYAAIGLSAEDMSAKIAAGGDGAQDALRQVADGILAIEDPAERANTAIALFGTPLEDLSVDQIPDFLDALSQGTGGMEGFSGASDELADNVEASLSSRLNALKGTLTDVATSGFMFMWDTVSALVDWIKANSSWLTPLAIGITSLAAGVTAFAAAQKIAAAGGLVSYMTKLATGTKLAAAAQFLFSKALWTSPITWIVAAIVGLVAGLTWFFTKTETGKKAWEAFTDALGTAWEWVVDKLSAGWDWLYENVLAPLGRAFSTVWDAVWPILQNIGKAWFDVAQTISKFYWSVIKVAWDALSAAAEWLWNTVLMPVFGFIQTAWTALSTAIMWAWNTLIKPAWDAISTAATILMAVVMTVLITPFMLAWNLLSTAIMWAWNTLIKPAWDAISVAAQWLWNTVLMPVFGWIKQGWDLLAAGIQFAWVNIIQPAWNAVSTAAQWLWNNVLSPVFGYIRAGWDLLSQGISNIWNNIIKPVWEAFGDTIDWVVHNIVEPAFEAVKTALSAVGDFFDTVVDGIKTVWNGLKEILAVPIRFLVETVYGKGIRPAWNAVAGFLPIDDAPEVALQFATGGAVSGPGTGTSDDIAAKLSNGEHVLTADEVNALGGQGNVYAMRGMIDSGKTFTVTPDGVYMSGDSKRDNGPAYPVLAFAEGGAVEKPAWETALERAHAWASSVNGRPYLTGSQWDAGGDCSGYMSAIASVAVGAEPNAGHWATPVFPASQGGTIHAGNQVWEPGLGQGLSIGMTGGPQSGGAMGHTAGTLSSAGSYGSVNVESGGSHGNVAYGGPAVGADDGQWKSGNYHLAIGADGAFESAGGPSPEQKKGWLRDKVKDIFDELLSPIDGVLDATVGTPPPEFFGIPRDSMEGSRDSAIDWFFDKIEGLGELLGSAYDTAKGLGSAIVDGAKDAAGAVWNNTLGRFLADGGYTGVSENHVAQIARGGAWRVWAEDETGGEAYIPLASGKRARSTEILGQVAGMFGYDLVDQNGAGYEVKGLDVSVPGTHFADGGVRTADDMLRFAKGEEVAGVQASRSLQGAPYVYGGSDWGDCSSAMSALAAFMIGDSDPMPRKFSTADEGAWLSSHGFSSGRGGTGALTIGWNGEHTSGMLPDGTLVEMSNPDDGGFIGSGAQSLDAAGYTDFAHIAAKTAEALTTAADATTTAATATAATGDTSRPKTIAGRVGDAAEETTNGVLDFFGIKGTWMDDPSQLGIETEASTTADAMSDAAVATETADMTSTVPTANAETAAPVEVKPSTDWGQAYFAFQIAKQAKDMSLGASGAKIGVATSLVETGDPMKMYANNAVPESLNYRHDAVGFDGTSVGLFQQTEGNGWGTVADRMDAYKSAGMFYDVMLDFFPDWKTMDPGSVAQGVQRSAYPDRYSTQMSRAQQLVDQTGLFDQGGVLDHKRFALNLSGKPEAILTNEQWEGLANIATTAAEASTGPVGVTDPAVGGPSGVDTTGPVSSRSGAAGQDGMVVNLNIDKVETQDPEAASRELMREARRVLAQFV